MNAASRLQRARAAQSNGVPIEVFHAEQKAEMKENAPNAKKGIPGKALKNVVEPGSRIEFDDCITLFEDKTLSEKKRVEKSVQLFKKFILQEFPPENFGIIK